MAAEHTEHEQHWPNYLKIWLILLVLTGTSIVATLLVTSFVDRLSAGAAHVVESGLLAFLFSLGAIKAALVVANFMHLRFEGKYLWALGLIALFFVGFFLAGTFFDISSTQKR